MSAVTSTTIWYTMRASGTVALVLLTLTTVLGILTVGRSTSPSWPAFARADLHKRVSLVAVVFVALHVLTALLDSYVTVGWLTSIVPFASHYRPLWIGLGTVSVDLMAAVLVSSALRRRIPARTWRGIHWLAYGSWPVAMAHSLGVGTDASALWFDVLTALCAAAVVVALIRRVSDQRHHDRRAGSVGAATRVPSRRPVTVPRRVVSAPPPEARPASVPSAVGLLERDRP